MTDNVNVLPSDDISSVSVATDDIGGVHYPVYKLAYGADGSQTPVDAVNPLPIDCTPLAMGEIYTDGVYKYFGEAQPGSDITDPVWRVSRLTIIGKRIEWANGNTNFDNTYDDIATVEAFSYS